MAQEEEGLRRKGLSSKRSTVTNKNNSVILEGDCYLNFINSLKSEVTSECYRNALIRFMKFCKISNAEDLAKSSPAEIEFYLKRYLVP